MALLIRISDASRRPAPERPAAPDEQATMAIKL
jgi:hypothetical protein